MKIKENSRPLWAISALLLAAVFLACFLAPFIYNFLGLLGRHFQALESLRESEFPRVFNRVLMIFSVGGLFLALRMAGMASFAALGFPKNRKSAVNGLKHGILLGCASMALLTVMGFIGGAYRFDAAPGLAGGLFSALLAGILLGFLEEAFFRGFLYGGLRKKLPVLPAALAVSAFYAVVHVLKPSESDGYTYAAWSDGFRYAGDVFSAGLGSFFPSLVTLFLAGIIFCALYEKTRNLYAAAGLHGAWVFLSQALPYFITTNVDRGGLFFNGGVSFVKNTAGLVIVAVLLAVILARRVENKSKT